MLMENEMKNLLGYIGCILLLVVMFFTLLKFNSSDYLTTFASETRSPQLPSSSEPQELSTVRIVENPNESKTDVFIYSSITITFTTKSSGQFFDSSKYREFVTYSIAQEQTFNVLDLLNDVQDRYSKWITLFVALFSIYLINRKYWISLSSF